MRHTTRNILIGLAALIVLAGIGLVTAPGHAVIAGIIERMAAENGLKVEIEGLSGLPPFSLHADRITVADGDGMVGYIEDMDLRIHAAKLVRHDLAFKSITAGRIVLNRAPHLPAGTSSGGALLPFAADTVSVARLELGAGVAGRAATLSLDGAATSGSDGSFSARIDARRIDGRAGTLSGTVTRANGSAPPVIDLTLAEDADGALAGLIGQNSAPAYRLAAKTTASGDALSGTVSLQSNGAAHFAGDFTLSPADGGEHIVAKGDGDLGELTPPGYADLVSGPIAMAVDAAWTGATAAAPPQITINQGTLTTGSVRATASGTLGSSASNAAFTVAIARADGGAITLPVGPAAKVTTVTLAGKAMPEANVIRVEITGQIAGLMAGGNAIPGAGVSLAVEAPKADPLAGGKLPFALRVEAGAIQTPTGRIESAAGAPIVLTADGTYDTAAMRAATNAKLAIGGGAATFAGTLSADGAAGTLGAQFADLAPLAPLAGRPLAGGLAAQADGTVGAQSALKVTGTATDLGFGEATLTRLLAGTTQFAGSVTTSADGALAFTDISIKGAAASATGNLALTVDTIEGALDGSISDLALVADRSSGTATISAKASGARDRPTLSVAIGVATGRLLDQPVQNATVQFDGAPANGGWQGTLALKGALAGKPLTGTATATLDAAGLLAFPAVDLTVSGNRISGAVARTAGGSLSGTLSVSAPSIAPLAALALVNAAGSGNARIDLAADGERQSLAVSFTGRGVAANGFAAASITGNANIADAFGTPQVSGNAHAAGVTAGSLKLDAVDATATVAGAATQFTAKASGSNLNLAGSGALAATAGGQSVRIATLAGTAFGLPVALDAPVTINLAGGRPGLSGAVVAIGGGTVRLDGTISPTLNLTLVVTNVAAAVANGVAPTLGAAGTVSGRATLSGPTSAPAIAWSASWAGMQTAATRNAGLPALALTASGHATLKATSLSARLSGAGLALAIDGQLPFAGSGLALKATGTAPLALIALQSDRELRLGGSANVNVAVSGTIAAPAISGTADLAAATIADTDTGLGISGASGRITFNGQQATTTGIRGKLVQGGDITIAGSLTVTGAGLPADLTIKIVNGRYADGRIVNTQFNADLALKGPLIGNGTLAGKVTLARTEIELPDRIAGAATAIPVTHVNAPPGFTPPVARQAPEAAGAHAGGALALNVTLAANSGLFVRGFGIDSEFGGTLTLTGTSGNPQTAGAFQMQRGRIEMLGRRFDFQTGTLTFSGDLVPVLAFTGTTTTTGGTVTLTVSGPANDPEISFSSSPALPQEEILAELLFDRTVGSLSPLQAAQLVDAVAQLTGALGGGGLFDKVREATGLDDLDIRQNATGGTTVGLGKRINDNLQVGVEGGSGAGAGRVTVDLNLTKGVKAQAAAGQDGSGQVGLNWEHEY